MAIRKSIDACVLNGDCDISLHNRSTCCKYCRYQKCLRIGMNPDRVGGSGRVTQGYLHREPTSLEATITEENWTENALAIVSKVRCSQEDVDILASWLSGFKTVGSPVVEDDTLDWAMNVDKRILSGIVHDLDNLKLDHNASIVAHLWMNVMGIGCGNIANMVFIIN